MQHRLSISVIVPVFNEENQIAACLDALAAQTVMPTEVIVVDNNCTDETARIARGYDFVRVVHEHHQGLIAARNRGFFAAKGDILARIDADTHVMPDWVERLQLDYTDDSVDAVGGATINTLTPLYGPDVSTFWSRLYLAGIGWLFNVPIMWGSNMSLRASTWASIKDKTCKDDALVHEDQDLSIVLASLGHRVIIDPYLLATSVPVTAKLLPYLGKMFRTFRYHLALGSFAHARPLHRRIYHLFVPLLAVSPVAVIFGLCFLAGFTLHSLDVAGRRIYASFATLPVDDVQ